MSENVRATTPVIRLGRVLFWACAGAGILVLLASAGIVVILMVEVVQKSGTTWTSFDGYRYTQPLWYESKGWGFPALMLGAGITAAALLYGLGRACRYVLSGE